MLRNEAVVLSHLIDRYEPIDILDCGSGSRADRTIVQPWIGAVFQGHYVFWSDCRHLPRVLFCDYMIPEQVSSLPVCEMVTAFSLLEHVSDIDTVINNIASRARRWVIVSVPHVYPPHECPIDNGWRPTPRELANRLRQHGLSTAEEYLTSPEQFGEVANASASVVVAEVRNGRQDC